MDGKESRKPIGVFDSGLGGLTVVRELRRRMPAEDIIYFGDLARLPYGTKSKKQITEFSIGNAVFLLRRNIKVLVVACNSSSSASLPVLRKSFHIPIFDVIRPAVKRAVKLTKSGRLGVIGTQATVDSKAYEKALRKLRKDLKVFTEACPLFVPVVEEGLWDGKISRMIADMYLKGMSSQKIDTLILGCTHYPLLTGLLGKYFGKGVSLVNSAEPTVDELSAFLEKKNMAKTKGKGKLEIFVSDKPRNFSTTARKFLGESLGNIKLVRV